jgi:hypothetical protein
MATKLNSNETRRTLTPGQSRQIDRLAAKATPVKVPAPQSH